MSDIIKDCSDLRLVEAIETSWFELFAYWGLTPYGEVYENQYLKRVNIGFPYCANGVFLAKLTPENLNENIDESLAYFKERGWPMTWWTGPTTRPSDLGRHLEARGLTHESDMPGMAVDLHSMNEDLPKPEGLTIEHVEDVETLKKYMEVMCPNLWAGEFTQNFFDLETSIGFDKSLPRRTYIGYLDRKPVASSHMLLTSGVAGIFCVATVPEARRKGIGTQITLAPLREAREMGYRVGVLQSSQIGLGVYRRIGFEEYCKIGVYRWQD